MNVVRYGLALLLLMFLPPALLFWLLIHPFVRAWRRIDPGGTYGLVLPVLVGVMVVLFLVRRLLLAHEFETSYPLIGLGLGCLAGATTLSIRLRRHLSLRTLVGVPELAPHRYPQPLLTEGLYARMRHPRYVALVLALLGYALIANFAAIYLLWGLSLPAVSAIAVLEERELRERFGKEYDAYRRRVPRFVPRFTGSR